MARFFLFAVGAILALALWTAFVGAGTLEGWWRTSPAPKDDARAFLKHAVIEIDTSNRGNAAFALIERGRVVGEHFVSTGKPVDRDTLFQVASLSKWITAWGVMTLVDAGKLDLDAPVSKYLSRWRLPESRFDNNGVTVRRLLSHTAGLTDGLGYGGFDPDESLQSLEDSLTQAADASPGASGAVRVGYAPGTDWKYSGGGYTLLQLLIEEVSGEPFDVYMRRYVLDPLGMTRSTFVLGDDATNVAEFFDPDGLRATHYRFTATAAASLYTSVADVMRFIQAHVPGANGEPAGRGVLSTERLAEMRRPHAWRFGAAIWGLGTILYVENNAGDFIIGHDGSNAPAINTAARLDPATGDAIVVLETGSEVLASKLAGEWVFWSTGNVDLVTLIIEAGDTLWLLAGGWIAILVLALLAGWRFRRRT